MAPSNLTHRNVESLDLKFIKRQSFTKYQLNMSKHMGQKYRQLCLSSILISVRGITHIRLRKRDQRIVYKIGPGNRQWGAFTEKCTNDRTILHDTKGRPIVVCLRKMHLWGSKSHAVYSIPLCFYLGWSAYFGTMSKIRVWPYYNGYMTGGGG